MDGQAQVCSLREGDAFLGYLLAQEAAFRTSAKGTEYLELTLSDSTGRMKAFLWDLRAVEGDMEMIRQDVFVKAKGSVTSYGGRLQLKLDKVRFADDGEVPDLSGFFPLSKRERGEMLSELDGMMDGLGDPWLKLLAKKLLGDGSALRSALAKAPAAKQLHHATVGGLLEHTLSVARMAEAACAHYRAVDRDLVLAAALLHDIGKTAELSYERSFAYTDEGNLLGHITIGTQWVQESISDIKGFPSGLRAQLMHILLSHHGKLEFGSPVLPKTPEALLVHYLDDLDGKLEAVFSAIRDDPGGGNWTQWNKALERILYKVRPAEVDAEPARSPARQQTLF